MAIKSFLESEEKPCSDYFYFLISEFLSLYMLSF